MLTDKIQNYYSANSYRIQYLNIIGIKNTLSEIEWSDKIGYWTLEGELKLFPGTIKPLNIKSNFYNYFWKKGVHDGELSLIQFGKIQLDIDGSFDTFDINCARFKGNFTPNNHYIKADKDWDLFFNKVLDSEQKLLNYLLLTDIEYNKLIA